MPLPLQVLVRMANSRWILNAKSGDRNEAAIHVQICKYLTWVRFYCVCLCVLSVTALASAMSSLKAKEST